MLRTTSSRNLPLSQTLCCLENALQSPPPWRGGTPVAVLTIALIAVLSNPAPARAAAPEVVWTEDFATDPVAAGRFAIRPVEAVARFAYDADSPSLLASYNTYQPTAWYWRLIDPVGGRTLGRYDDFEFRVAFRIRSAGFFADPDGFAQIAWGLVNSQTTGPDRAGAAGPYAYDCLTFDYFPNVSSLWGGPTLGSTIIHSDDGAGYYANIDFPFGAESTINMAAGDETVVLDTVYTARVAYDGAVQTATLTIRLGDDLLAIGAEGGGGPGGPDGDPATIQTEVYIDNEFTLDAFALTAWQDGYSPFYASVIADVEVLRIEFHAPAVLLGDLSRDGSVDGLDIAPFIAALLAGSPDPGILGRGDGNDDGVLTVDDVNPFVALLVQP